MDAIVTVILIEQKAKKWVLLMKREESCQTGKNIKLFFNSLNEGNKMKIFKRYKDKTTTLFWGFLQ